MLQEAVTDFDGVCRDMQVGGQSGGCPLTVQGGETCRWGAGREGCMLVRARHSGRSMRPSSPPPSHPPTPLQSRMSETQRQVNTRRIEKEAMTDKYQRVGWGME